MPTRPTTLILKYVSKASNHPPCIPSSIEKRLNTISSSEAEFNEAKTDYERALGNAGYSAEIKYNAEQNRATRTSRKRRRRIVWYNTPFSKNVTTNIGREFLSSYNCTSPSITRSTATSTKTPSSYRTRVLRIWIT